MATSVSNIGAEVIRIARTKLDCAYVLGAEGPSTFDCSGLVWYCYKQAGKNIGRKNCKSYYNKYIKDSNVKKIADKSSAQQGDLILYSNGKTEASHIALAVNSKKMIHAAPKQGGVKETNWWNETPMAIFRILADTETSTGTSTEESTGGTSGSTTGSSSSSTGTNTSHTETVYGDTVEAVEYGNISVYDPYKSTIITNLSTVEASGFDYGYLIDLKHSREFKFYIPEFTEQAGANWESISIMGRSSAIQAYKDTNSRSITISLDLFAGVGLYNTPRAEDVVGKMHEDIAFVKSLEYPDYSNTMIEPPPTVQLILGPSVNIIGVVGGVSVQHMKPVDLQNRSMYVKLSFTVTEALVNPLDYRDILDGRVSINNTENRSSMSSTRYDGNLMTTTS